MLRMHTLCGLQRLPLSWLTSHLRRHRPSSMNGTHTGAARARAEGCDDDPKTTALLVMDLIKQACNDEKRPRCVASIPKIATLLASARASGVSIIYTIVPAWDPLARTGSRRHCFCDRAKADEPV